MGTLLLISYVDYEFGNADTPIPLMVRVMVLVW